jgi:hypothetical protein
MREKLKGLYSEVVRTALMTYQVNTITIPPSEMALPVIPGAFPGESVFLSYARERDGTRTVKISVPTGSMASLIIGPFPMPVSSGNNAEVPKAVLDLLDQFARTGPERLQGRFRGLVKELFRAGVTADEVNDEVRTALAESVMES